MDVGGSFQKLKAAASYISLKAQSAYIRLAGAALYQRLASSIGYTKLSAEAAYTKLSFSTNYTLLRAAALLGEFLKSFGLKDAANALDQFAFALLKSYTEQIGTSDATVKAFNKSRTEQLTASVLMARSLTKPFADSANSIDSKTITLARATSDTTVAGDQAAKTLSRGRSEAASASDVFARTVGFTRDYTEDPRALDSATRATSKVQQEALVAGDARYVELRKGLADSAYATDDVNGAAADDDQVMQFLKAISEPLFSADVLSIVSAFTRAYSDSASASDLANKQLSKTKSDTAVTADSGFVKSQGYCDIEYFAEDYVGATRTF